MKRNLLILITMLLTATGFAQCPDFTDLNAPGVQCFYGMRNVGAPYDDAPFINTGLVPGRHTVITAQGTDPNTGDLLPLLPPGEDRVIKLGNEQVGYECEAIAHTFTVDPDSAILLLKFAVVFQNPQDHPYLEQPRFVMRVLDSLGQLVDSCAEYDVSAAAGIPGFQTFGSGYQPVRWRPWTHVAIDLSRFIGQKTTVQFITYDCGWGAHYGYAYFTGQCISNKLELTGCEGNEVTLFAPPGFDSYVWDNGTEDDTAKYTVESGGTQATCLITSATGCQYALSAYITNLGPGIDKDTTIYDTICQGDSYTQNYFDLPIQNRPGTFHFRNSFIVSDPDNHICESKITSTLYLTVLQREFHFYDAICEGESYHRHGFDLETPAAGFHTRTRESKWPNDCDSLITLHLTVSPSFENPLEISGETNPCQNEIYTYSIPGIENLATCRWELPSGATIIKGQGTASIDVYFSDCKQDTLWLHCANGCGADSLFLVITPNPAYHLVVADTLCTGNEYHKHGFELPRQDSVGYFTFIDRYQTAAGCDSVYILTLWVTATPEIEILAQPEMLCQEDNEGTDLHAMGSLADTIAGGTIPAIAIGDILCTDNSIVKPDAYAAAGKTAMGIVFFVDNTGEHGWATALRDSSSACKWSASYVDIPSLANIEDPRMAIKDLDGNANTNTIKAHYGSNFTDTTAPAAYNAYYWDHTTNSVGTEHKGWYLPAAGQLRYLYSQIYPVNASLDSVGGTQLPVNQYFYYWSSTEYSSNTSWSMNNSGTVGTGNKSSSIYNRVRSVRAF